MGYVIVNKVTRIAHRGYPRNGDGCYKTEAAAKAAITRHGLELVPDYVVMEESAYRAQVPMVARKNLMTGKEFQIALDQVGTCIDPSTERYWSM